MKVSSYQSKLQLPKECFDFNETKRIQVGASKFEYGVLSTRHVYYFNTPELEKWLHDKKTNANYEFPQLGTPTNIAKKYQTSFLEITLWSMK